MTLVSSFVCFQLFCLVFLSIIERGVLKSSTINVLFSIFFSSSDSFYFMYIAALFGIYIFKIANLGGLILI